MYFKLIGKNIKKSYKDYVIYFLTLIFGVCVFYTFNSIESQGIMMNLSETKRSAFEAAETLMGYFSVFIAFVLGFLIIYANNYLIKRRKKEFGVYITLGMEKGTLSRMVFLETLIIGVISLGVGIVLGVILSQGLSVLTAYMFQVDLTKFTFVFSKNRFIKTVLCFSLIYLVVLVFNFLSIRKIKLIDLLTASKKNEKPIIKNLWVSSILFLVSIGMIGTDYYKVLHDGIAVVSAVGLPILLDSVGTFIFFYSLTGFFLKVIQSNKRIYFRDLNMFVMKQISSKINTAFISLSLNVERYKLLRELGVDDSMINKALFTQIGIYFMLPLSLAIVHSIVGLKVSSTIVRLFGDSSIVTNVILTAVILVVIYGGYFLATYLSAKKNISEKY